jgi:hypothetical protein
MTPAQTECNAKSYVLGQVEKRSIVANFSGGDLTSDGGLMWIVQLDQHYRISERLAACFQDQRAVGKVQHSLTDLVAQRLYGLVQGYEDLNDHDHLRQDPLFQIGIGKRSSTHARCAPLAGKSTLNRLEQAMPMGSDLSQARYVKFTVDSIAIAELLTEVSLDQAVGVPRRIMIDLDVTNDETHGDQAESFFNGYYDQTCYAPLLIYWGHRLLGARLRPSNVDPAAGALEEVQRIIGQIRQRWARVPIIIRGDSAYGREDLMSWCEAQAQVEYVVAHASNARLQALTWHTEQRAKAAYEQQRQAQEAVLVELLGRSENLQQELDRLVPPQVWYQALSYRTQDSWSRSWRVVCKVTYDATGVQRHFVVTSLNAKQAATGKVHTDYYQPRGEMENRIKEHQLDLFSDRTSTHEFESNQLRLWWSSFAYVLMQAFRQHGLAGTELAQAQCGTIRSKLLKVAAQVRFSVRRVVIAFSEHWAGQSLFVRIHQRLQRLRPSG